MRIGVALVLLAGCLEPQLAPCGDDLSCPANTVCVEALEVCVTQEQLDACLALADGAACNALGAIGECRDGACLIAICGDGFVEPGETCDDGNRVSADGCSASCTSTEDCGNGVVDLPFGELCDDGNRVSADGCDSRCRTEQYSWSLEGVAPSLRDAVGRGTYDIAHHQLLHVTEGITWTWTGTRWTIVASAGLPLAWRWQRLLYAPDRSAAILVGSVGTPQDNGAIGAWEWDGAAWHPIAIDAAPFVGTPLATYDTARNVVLVLARVVAGYQLYSLELATGRWADRGVVAATGFSAGFAFDEARGRAVLAQIGGTSSTTEWDGTAWSAPITSTFASRGTLVFDPRLRTVVSAGTSIWSWSGAAWTAIQGSTAPSPRDLPEVAFDRDRHVLVMFGGTVGQSWLDDIYEWDGAAWTANLRAWPRAVFDMSLAFDPIARVLVQHGDGYGDATGIATWTYDGTRWRELPRLSVPSLMFPFAYALAYDPMRRAFVTSVLDRSTWLLHDDGTWEALESPATSAVGGCTALAYDPSRGGVVGVNSTATWFLGSTATQWTRLGSAPSNSAGPAWLAYDARANQLVMSTQYVGASVFDGQTWMTTVSPGRGFFVVANQRRGTIELMSPQRPAYERVDGAWVEGPAPPYPVTGSPAYDPVTGELVILGDIGAARVVLRRRVVGAAPVDACAGGDDDGDALVDCADPDCWWSCTPACPPLASCP